MSIKQIVKVWEHEFPHYQQSVMIALADHADDDGKNIRPSVAHLAWKTGYKPRRVQEILKELREDVKVLKLVVPGVGRGNPSEYEIDWSEATPKRPWEEVREELRAGKGANNAPFGGPEKVHSEVEKVQPGVEKGALRSRKGALASAPEPSEPSHNRQEPSVEERLPDDTTSRCLLLLKKVKGLGKDYGELALLLAELREEFPFADPEEVCRDYEFNHRVGKEKTKVHASKLRSYFRTANTSARNGRGRGAPPVQASLARSRPGSGGSALPRDEEARRRWAQERQREWEEEQRRLAEEEVEFDVLEILADDELEEAIPTYGVEAVEAERRRREAKDG